MENKLKTFTEKTESIEVQLVEQVRKCKSCKWFWGEIPPYGPYPGYDWNKDYPTKEELINSNDEKEEGIVGKLTGYSLIEPSIASGCRKAPIQTIGINPNVTAFQPGVNGATWSYPIFDNQNKYAYYYRTRTIYQESLDIANIHECINPETAIIAKEDGYISYTGRSNTRRWMKFTIAYPNNGESSYEEFEETWAPGQRFVLLFNRGNKTDSSTWFKKGDIIGGVFEPKEKNNVNIYDNVTGYYERFQNVLNLFKSSIGEPLSSANIAVGEDVLQNDMIACASPGWSSKYDIEQNDISGKCVDEHAWVIAQLFQSDPKILVIVSSSTAQMFWGKMGVYIDFKLENDDDAFDLLKKCMEEKHYLEIEENEFSLKTRLLVSPHFSYPDNFVPHCRFRQNDWNEFEEDYSKAVEVLNEHKLVSYKYERYIINVQKNDQEIKNEINDLQAWGILMDHYYAPFEMMASVLEDEYKAGNLTFDEAERHLTRTEGPCNFCDNRNWQFPGGCFYNKAKESNIAAENVMKAAYKTMERAVEFNYLKVNKT